MRLTKFIADCGVVSRRKAQDLIAQGGVRINGKVCAEPGTVVDPVRDRIEVAGKRVKPEEPYYRLLLKPRECLSTLVDKKDEDGRKRPCLTRYMKDTQLPWVVVGPIDYPSEGVILLTTDGAMAEQFSKNKNKLTMTYHVKFQGHVGEAEISRLLKGYRVDGRPVTPIQIYPLATTGKNTWIEIVVREIRPRVIRVAGDVIRRHVLKISRTKFGDLSFEGLKMGAHRELNAKEVASLQRAAGIR